MVSRYYEQRATAGGLIITESTAISPGAGAPIGTPGIYNAEQIKAWKQVTTAVHKKGGLIFMQVWHLGRAGSNPVSSSDIAIASPSPLGGGAFDRPQALSVDGILAITQEFVQAAKNAIEAGFDGKLKQTTKKWGRSLTLFPSQGSKFMQATDTFWTNSFKHPVTNEQTSMGDLLKTDVEW
jgi:hypothetical protein